MKTSYRNYFIFSEAMKNEKGTFDQRVILQKIGTSKISVYHPCCESATKGEAEDRGTDSAEKIIDKFTDINHSVT